MTSFQLAPVDGVTPRSSAVRGGIHSIILKLIYAAGQLALGVVLARVLQPIGLGHFAFIMALVQVLLVTAQWGIPTLLTREIAIRRIEASWAAIRTSILGGLTLAVLLGTTTAAIWLIFDRFTNAEHLSGIGFAVLLVPVMALAAVSSGALRGLGHPVASLLAEETLRPWLALGMIAIAFFAGRELDLLDAFAIQLAAAVVALVLSIWLLARFVPAEVKAARSQWAVAASGLAGFPFLLQAGAQTLSLQTDTILLGLLTPGAPVGLYRTAAQIAEGLGVVLIGVATVLAPRLAEAHTDAQRLRMLLVYSHRAGVALMVPALVVAVVCGPQIITFLFGPQYIGASLSMQILVAGKVLYAAGAFGGLALAMIGRTWIAAGIAAAVIVINVILDLLLIPRFGIVGAAVADTGSNFLVTVGVALYLRHLLGGGVSALASVPTAHERET